MNKWVALLIGLHISLAYGMEIEYQPVSLGNNGEIISPFEPLSNGKGGQTKSPSKKRIFKRGGSSGSLNNFPNSNGNHGKGLGRASSNRQLNGMDSNHSSGQNGKGKNTSPSKRAPTSIKNALLQRRGSSGLLKGFPNSNGSTVKDRSRHHLRKQGSQSINSPLFLTMIAQNQKGSSLLRKASSGSFSQGISEDLSQVLINAVLQWNNGDIDLDGVTTCEDVEIFFNHGYENYDGDDQRKQYIKKVWKLINSDQEDPLRWVSMLKKVLSWIQPQENELSATTSSANTQANKMFYQGMQNRLHVKIVQEFQNKISKPVWQKNYPSVLDGIIKSYDDDSPYKERFIDEVQSSLLADQKKLTRTQQKIADIQKLLITIQTGAVTVLKNQHLMPVESEIPAERDDNKWVAVQEVQLLLKTLFIQQDEEGRALVCGSIKAIADRHAGESRLLFLTILAQFCTKIKLQEVQRQLKETLKPQKGGWFSKPKSKPATISKTEKIVRLVTKSVRDYIVSHLNDYEPSVLKDLFYTYINTYKFSEYYQQDRDLLIEYHTRWNLRTFAQLTGKKGFLPDLDLDELDSEIAESNQSNGASTDIIDADGLLDDDLSPASPRSSTSSSKRNSANGHA